MVDRKSSWKSAVDAMFDFIWVNFEQANANREIIGFLYLKMLAYCSMETIWL